jgi:hypothetical protein
MTHVERAQRRKKPRARQLPRWEERGDKVAQDAKIHLVKIIPKLINRVPSDTLTMMVMQEPLTEDECDLLTKILDMIRNREDPRTLLYKPASGKSRPPETERDLSIARRYAIGLLLNKEPKAIRSWIAEDLEKNGEPLSDERIRKIVQRQKLFIDSELRGLRRGHLVET